MSEDEQPRKRVAVAKSPLAIDELSRRFHRWSLELHVATAFGLGAMMGVGVATFVLSPPGWHDLGLFFCLLSFFHLWEWFYVALFHPTDLSTNSFLINHSPAFIAAWALCFSEYLIERAFFPWLKGNALFVYSGFAVAVCGQAIRTVAMITAGTNFHHIIEDDLRPGHVLVTTGIYNVLRHPSYFGWFWWANATQLLLANPVCMVGFAAATWMFFKNRIEEEEELLCSPAQFGEQYVAYRRRTFIGIPFIR
eukprot:m51a1_g12309 putative prenyl cysteine carboxyl (251) ;mRNA; r:382826-383792